MKVIYHVDVREELTDKVDTEYVNKYPEQVELAVQEVFSKALNIDLKTVSVGLEIVKEDQ
ncbi:hypothetical protein G166_gp38 [Clostridium phage phi8074-B1]|uniref:hypothetical protein n=1 Tax=Clostridium phage phi8074-B1 TaxID=1147137 RepID=UPI00025C0C59|nr:hypothetical protein G166_gp38 [Clostridium phage phi8074-B1]AFC61970.1 hypothetical protein phi8074-B1_00038 [Clostridium phage phi8074-B1]